VPTNPFTLSKTTAARSESEAQTFTVVESKGLRPESASQVSPHSLQDVINRLTGYIGLQWLCVTPHSRVDRRSAVADSPWRTRRGGVRGGVVSLRLTGLGVGTAARATPHSRVELGEVSPCGLGLPGMYPRIWTLSYPRIEMTGYTARSRSQSRSGTALWRRGGPELSWGLQAPRPPARFAARHAHAHITSSHAACSTSIAARFFDQYRSSCSCGVQYPKVL
jgi:hypothetical protein